MKKNKNYKLFIGIIVGIVVSASGVMAASYKSAASEVEYDNSTSGLLSSNVQDALDELYTMKDCPSEHYCKKYKTELEVGDYVYYKPEKKSYQVDTSMTGYTGTEEQIIYPEELELWRVLNINSDGTVELISEYVSSTSVYFEGQKGYLNAVGYLNILAEQYETEGITDATNGSRHFGYNGQIEFIEDTEPSTIFVPITTENATTLGEDSLYITDYDRANTVLGTKKANKVGTVAVTSYWIASRDIFSERYSSYMDSWCIRAEYGRTNTTMPSILCMYEYDGSVFSGVRSRSGVGIRPIVTLKSGLQYEGFGVKKVPMKIISS